MIIRKIFEKVPALKSQSDIALLFFLEAIIASGVRLPLEDMDWDIFEKEFGLEGLTPRAKILLFFVVYELYGEHDKIMHAILDSGELLEFPAALFLVTDYLRRLDEENFQQYRKLFDRITREAFDQKNFTAHVQSVAQEVCTSESPDDEDIEYILLAQANIFLLRGHVRKAKDYIQKAQEYGSIVTHTMLSEIQEIQDQSHQAIKSLQAAYLENPNVYTLEEWVRLAQEHGDFESAQQAIEIGIRNGYTSMRGYIVAELLLQEKYIPAFREYIHADRSDQLLPEGVYTLLAEKITHILASHSMDYDALQTKILASYLDLILRTGTVEEMLHRVNIHLTSLETFISSFSSPAVEEGILGSVAHLTDEIDFSSSVSSTQQAIGYLHMHIVALHERLRTIFYQRQSEEDIE